MQEKYSNFDREIRSLLQNAEEEVPSGVWDAVSAGLDKAESSSRAAARKLRQRFFIGISAAAAVALGIFAAGVSDNSNKHISHDRYNLAANIVSSAEESERSSGGTVYEENPSQDILSIDKQIEGMKGLTAGNFDRRTGTAAEAVPAGALSATTVPPAEAVSKASEALTKAEAATQEETATITEAAPQEEAATATEENAVSQRTEEKTVPEKKAMPEDFSGDAGMLDRLAADEKNSKSRTGKTSFSMSGNFGGNFSGETYAQDFHKSPGMSATQNIGIHELSDDSVYGVPVTVGIGVKFALSNRWSVGTGIEYSLLTRTFRGIYTDKSLSSVSSDIRNSQHYIGIPLNLYYNILNGRRFRLYAHAGGSVEKNIGDRYRIREVPGLTYDDNIKGLQWSAGGGFGAEYMIIPEFGVFFDPGIRYYFDNGQSASILTQEPWMINLEIGLRFRLGKR